MAKRILVAYDTIHGSTAEIAEFVGKELIEEGNVVEVHRVTEVADVNSYQAVVVGSPVKIENWTEDAVDFLSRHKHALSQRPIAMFFTCLATLKRTPEDGLGRVMTHYVSPLLEQFPDLKPVSIGVFTGVLDYNKYTEEGAAGIRRFMSERGAPVEGRHDCRDWQAIRVWSKEVSTRLETSKGEWVVVATGQR